MTTEIAVRRPSSGIANNVTGSTTIGYVAAATIDRLGYADVLIMISANPHDLLFKTENYMPNGRAGKMADEIHRGFPPSQLIIGVL